MSMNRFGQRLVVTTFGESHGPAIGCVIDGCPPGLAIDEAMFATDLARRATGKTRHTSQRKEADVVEILSGVYDGVSTGTPIALLIRNTDARPKDYTNITDQFRPGHADYSYHAKYGVRDPRGGGRSSARETTMRVVAGCIAKRWLAIHHSVDVFAWVSQLGELTPKHFNQDDIESNPFFWPDASMVGELEAYMDALRKSGDSIGARVRVCATGVPAGWGEPVYGKLSSELAAAMMSINAVKGVDVGAGFDAITQRGTEHRDEITPEGFATNHAGGLLGGIATGQPITMSVAFKPTSSLRLAGQTINTEGEAAEIITKGRHDPCVALRAPPIVEAMMALTLMDHALRHRGQCGDQTHSPVIPGSISGNNNS